MPEETFSPTAPHFSCYSIKAGERAARDLTEAKGAIHELHTKIKDVKSKAEQSEMMVQEICRDIKQLDYAKRHLQTTITALKRLHMLVTAVKQLEIMAKDKHYREAANLLDAVSQLLTHFEPYAEIARIRELRETVDQIKKGLTEEIMHAFNRIGALADSVADPAAYDNKMAGDGQFSTLSEACLVVDALGPEAAQRQLLPAWQSERGGHFSRGHPRQDRGRRGGRSHGVGYTSQSDCVGDGTCEHTCCNDF